MIPGTDVLVASRERFGFGEVSARRAIVFAAFGQRYLDETIENVCASPALRELSRDEGFKIVVLTSRGADLSCCPPMARAIEVPPFSGWPSSDRYLSRFCKWGLPSLFQGIDTSVYLDSDIAAVSGPEQIRALFTAAEAEGFIVNRHPRRRSWKEEYAYILFRGRHEDAARLRQHYDHLEALGVPLDMPVCQNKMLARKHGSRFDRLSLLTLGQILRFSERDQLGFMAARRECGLEPRIEEEGVYLYKDHGPIREASLCFAAVPSKASAYAMSLRSSKLKRMVWRTWDSLRFRWFKAVKFNRVHARQGE